MQGQNHSIGTLNLSAQMADEDLARNLLARVEAFAHDLAPPVFQRVFDSLIAADCYIRLARLELDLGTLPVAGFEDAALAALEQALRETLPNAVAAAAPGGEKTHATLTEARLELADFLLVHGTLPAWARAESFSLAALMQYLAANAPSDLVALLRRQGRLALERLVLRLDEEGLRRLLALLAPGDAVAILGYLADVILLHHAEPLVPLSEAGLKRLVWLLTFEYLLHEAGSRFNRRSFLARLIAGIAESEGLEYSALLLLLRWGLERTENRLPLGSSLPAVLKELLAEDEAASMPGDSPPVAPDTSSAWLARFENALRQGAVAPLAAVMAECSAEELPLLAELARRLVREPSTLHRLVSVLDAQTLHALLAVLDSEHAALVTSYLDTLEQSHHSQPLVPLGESRFTQLIWSLALGYVVREPGSMFNRRSLLRSLIEGIAAHESIEETDLMAVLLRGLNALGRRRVPTGSLLTVLEELLAEPPRVPRWANPLLLAESYLRSGHPSDAGPGLVLLLKSDPAGLAAMLRTLVEADTWPLQRERLLLWLLPEEVAELLTREQDDTVQPWGETLTDNTSANLEEAWQQILARLLGEQTPRQNSSPPRRFDNHVLLRHWLDHGTLPWWAPQGTSAAALISGLPDWPLADLHMIFLTEEHARSFARLWRAVDALGRETGRTVLKRLAPSPLTSVLVQQQHTNLTATLIRAAAATLTGEDPGDIARPAPPSELPPPPPQAPVNRALLLAWMAGSIAARPQQSEQLARLWAELADAGDEELRIVVLAGIGDAALRAHWLTILPDEILARVLTIVAPRQAQFLLEAATTLSAAWRLSGHRVNNPRLPWDLLFDSLAAHPVAAYTTRSLTEDLIQRMTARDPASGTRFLTQTRILAEDAGAKGLLAIIGSLAASSRATPPKAKPEPPRQTHFDDRENIGNLLYIGNAGLVLFNPFLPRFFDELGVLQEDAEGKPRIIGSENLSRAVHLLQHLVDERCDRPEHELVLNKLLCGAAPSVPITASILPSEEELALCAKVTAGVLANWASIRNTSPAGLRETFLQREGRLSHGDNGWALCVQRKTVDVLVDQIPWSFAVIYQRWMTEALHVTW